MLQRQDIQVTINANLLHDAMSIPESFQNGIFGKEEITALFDKAAQQVNVS